MIDLLVYIMYVTSLFGFKQEGLKNVLDELKQVEKNSIIVKFILWKDFQNFGEEDCDEF